MNPEGMHKSPVFSQGVIIPAGARTLLVDSQKGVDGRVVSNDLAGQSAKAVDNLIKVLETAGGTLNYLVRFRLYIKGEGDITPGIPTSSSKSNPPRC